MVASAERERDGLCVCRTLEVSKTAYLLSISQDCVLDCESVCLASGHPLTIRKQHQPLPLSLSADAPHDPNTHLNLMRPLSQDTCFISLAPFPSPCILVYFSPSISLPNLLNQHSSQCHAMQQCTMIS